MVSEPPEPLFLKPMPISEEPRGDFEEKWKLWIQDTMEKNRERIMKPKERCKKNHDVRLGRHVELIKLDDYVYLRIEWKDRKETNHKLSTVSEGPYKVMKTGWRTVFIEKKDRSVQKVWRSRDVWAKKSKTKD